MKCDCGRMMHYEVEINSAFGHETWWKCTCGRSGVVEESKVPESFKEEDLIWRTA